MSFKPPVGYHHVEPLRRRHRVRLPDDRQSAAVFGDTHLLPIGLSEFVPAARDYPIAFVQAGDGRITAVAVLGLQPGQNLFVMPEGHWDRRAYRPGYLRRYPFLMADVVTDEEETRAICIESRWLDDDGEPLFDADGAPGPDWRAMEPLVVAYEEDRGRCGELCARLERLEVLEAFATRVEIEGFTMELGGLFRVDREKLMRLPESDLRELMGSGDLDAVFAHFHSLHAFERMRGRRSFMAAAAPSVTALAS